MEAGLTRPLGDRRRSVRRARLEEHQIVWARVRPAHDVLVLDVSAGGVLLETSHRLMPGSSVVLHLRRESLPIEVVTGRVLRCRVARLEPSIVSYRGAVAFDRMLEWFTDQGGRVVHSRCEASTERGLRADATRNGSAPA
jgi:hypothetical protein